MIEKPSICVIISDANRGGMLLPIVEALSQKAHFLDVVVLAPNEVELITELGEIKITSTLLKCSSRVSYIYSAFKFGRLLQKSQYSHILASGHKASLIGMISAKFIGIENRFFIRHHSDFHDFQDLSPIKSFLGLLYDRLTNLFSTKIISVSETVRSSLINLDGVKPDKIKLIYNGIDLTKYEKLRDFTELQSKYSDRDDPQIGCMARISKLKGIVHVVEAFEKFLEIKPHAKLFIAGAPSDSWTEVKSALDRLPKDSWTHYEHLETANFLSKLDVFIHVPIRECAEAYGLVFMESIASGLQCVFTKSGIMREIESCEKYFHFVKYESSEEIYTSLKNIFIQNSLKPVYPIEKLSIYDESYMVKEYLSMLNLK